MGYYLVRVKYQKLGERERGVEKEEDEATPEHVTDLIIS